MKVAVITRHAVFNYGSLLQTIATQQCLKNIGCDCEIVDYQRYDEDYHKIAAVLLKNNKKWNSNILTRAVYMVTQSPKFWLMGYHFKRMRTGALNVTRKYKSYEELQQNKPEADCYMTGSDQVWGPIGADKFDPAYFLGFTDDSDKKVSYAASFGKTNFSDELLDEFKKYLSRYEEILVRERSAVDIIADMGIDNVRQVLDPTLLMTDGDWSEMIQDHFPDKYILIYQLHNNPKMMEYAYKLAEKTGLQLVSMSSTAQHLVRKGSKHVFLPTLSQWLGYIKNASFMITDSFHGTAFAINFNTQFVNILPEGTATRNQSILELTGLNDRVVTDYDDLECFNKKIDFKKVNEIIEQKRIQSYDALKKMFD